MFTWDEVWTVVQLIRQAIDYVVDGEPLPPMWREDAEAWSFWLFDRFDAEGS
ncbi:MAG: hypothetical protein J2P16_00185 [Mycobacterium sp.]|nr:hypothetical protein [Mycobacterium sp.]